MKSDSVLIENINIKNKEDVFYFPLSSSQRRLFILHELETNRTDYNLVNAVEIEGNISKDEIENIFQKIIDRHESLRTTFHIKNGEPVQRVHEPLNIKITEIGLSAESRSAEQIIYDYNKPFILSQLPLVRIGLINISGSKKILFFITHHIVFDATSMSLVMYEFLSMYKGIPLGHVKLQYKDYAIWENDRQKKDDFKLQKEYWLDKFSGDIPVLNLPSDFSRTPLLNKQGNKIFFSVDKSVSDGLIKISKDNQATLYIVLLSALNILLSKYSGQEDIIVGCPSAGRNHPDSLNTVGMFINTLPIRSCPKSQKSFTEFLYEVKNNVLNALSNQEYQFDSLVTELNLERDMTRNPLFDVMFNLKNSDFEVTNNTDLVFKQYYFKHISVIFDIYLVAEQNTTGLNFRVEYNKSLFLEETIKQLIRHFKNIITTIATDPKIQIKSIDILSSDEKDKILFGFNNTKVDYQKEKTITELFEEQVNKTPDNIGIICKDTKLTYKEINQKSNQLARLLRIKGVKPGSSVAIITNRSPEMIIAIISVLKSGGAYLPIDPNYPHDRILFLLKNCESKLILSQKEIIKTLHLQNDIICIDLDNNSTFSGVDSNPEKINSSDDLAYIIHTSGTTGRPNGVMVKHKPVVNLIEWVNKTFNINEDDRLLFVTSICFDLSVYDIFGILASGASIQLATDEDIKNPEELVNYLFNNNITFWDSAPTSLQQLVILFNNYNINKNTRLRLVFLSGDWIPLTLPGIMKTTFTGAEVISLGGATEATVWSNFFPINEINPDWKSIPYGKPIQNAKYYIFDSNMNVCPVGVSGDLFIGGECLSDGYINNEELTSYRFIKNPYSNDPNDIIYRTGDTARYFHDGNIEFLGRLDNQVKIRGFRIELGEIENALLQEKQISAAVVLAKPNTLGGKDLAAYYISSKEIDVSWLRKFLGKSLPDYMIPGYFVHIDSMPMTSNGKVDYKKLLQTEFSSTISSKHFILPRNQREEEIAKIWKEILNVQQVSLTDNFFYIGGDSIKALNLVSRMNKLGLSISINDIFRYQTIKAIMDSQKNTDVNLNEHKRNYNLKFEPSFYIYPYYYLCNNEILVESINYHLNLDIEKSFFPAANAYAYPGYISFFKPLTGYNYLEQLNSFLKRGNYISIKSSLVKAENYNEFILKIKSELAENKIVPVFGSSYFLHYSPTYKNNSEFFIENHERFGSMHQYFVIDIMNNGDALIYDTTFNYYGVIKEDEFYKSVRGIMDIPLLKNHPSVNEILPFRYVHYDFSNSGLNNFNRVRVELSKKILNDYIYNFYEIKNVDFEFSGQKEILYIGIEAIKKLVNDLKLRETFKITEKAIEKSLEDFPYWLTRTTAVYADFLTSLTNDFKDFEKAADLLNSITFKFSRLKFSGDFQNQIIELEEIIDDFYIVQNIIKDSLNKAWN